MFMEVANHIIIKLKYEKIGLQIDFIVTVKNLFTLLGISGIMAS